MLRIIPSLSGLFGYCRRNNTIPQDTPYTIYVFGSTREGIAKTLEHYPVEDEMLTKLLVQFSQAERDGRLSWRTSHNSMDSKFLAERTEFLEHHIKSRGGKIDMEFNGYEGRDLLVNAAWNIPAMQRFLMHCVSNLRIEVLDYAGIQTVDNWRV